MKNIAKHFRTWFLCGFLSLLLVYVPVASADELLDRLEAATERLGENQGAFYLSRIPELQGKIPDWQWDDEIRSASSCVLEGIAAAKGQAVAEAYVTGIEKDAGKEINSMHQMSEQGSLPMALQGEDQTLLNLMQACGTLEISAVRLKESGFWDEMMKPEIRKRLAAD